MKKCFIFLSFLFSFSATQAQIITSIAGNGNAGFSGDGNAATDAEFRGPAGIAIDNMGNLYFTDNYRIRKVSASGIITTIAGTGTSGYRGDGGLATVAEFDEPVGMAVDGEDNIYIADAFNNCIRKINNVGIITTIAGDGYVGYSGDSRAATAAELWNPTGIAVDTAGNLYIADGGNNCIRKVNTSGIITTIAGTGLPGFSGDGGPALLANLNMPVSVVADNYGNVYFSDYDHVRKVSASGIISTIAGTADSAGYNGDGISATLALLNRPKGIAVDANGNIYIADELNNRIRMVNASGIITTIAGTDTAGYNGDNILAITAELSSPNGVALNSNGNIYISDWGNHRIRYIKL